MVVKAGWKTYNTAPRQNSAPATLAAANTMTLPQTRQCHYYSCSLHLVVVGSISQPLMYMHAPVAHGHLIFQGMVTCKGHGCCHHGMPPLPGASVAVTSSPWEENLIHQPLSLYKTRGGWQGGQHPASTCHYKTELDILTENTGGRHHCRHARRAAAPRTCFLFASAYLRSTAPLPLLWHALPLLPAALPRRSGAQHLPPPASLSPSLKHHKTLVWPWAGGRTGRARGRGAGLNRRALCTNTTPYPYLASSTRMKLCLALSSERTRLGISDRAADGSMKGSSAAVGAA